MAEIALTDKAVAIVDEEDFGMVSSFCWHLYRREGQSYAIRTEQGDDGKRRTVYMHRIILGIGTNGHGVEVDHIDGNGLNNTRANLRMTHGGRNQWNRRKRKKGTSRHKGVNWNIVRMRWISRITVGRTRFHLGYFDSEDEAAIAYNEAARLYYGEMARLNVVDQSDSSQGRG